MFINQISQTGFHHTYHIPYLSRLLQKKRWKRMALSTSFTLTLLMNKENVTELRLIQPTVMEESKNTIFSLAMSKVLLERLLLRKELKLKNIQEKLEDQTQRLEAANKKIEEYEKMIGFKKFLSLYKLCSQMVRLSVQKASGTRRGL